MQTSSIFARSSTLIGFCFKYWKLNVSCLDRRLDCAGRAKTSNPLLFRSHSFYLHCHCPGISIMQPIATHWWLWSGLLRLLLFELLMDQVICPSLISVMFIHVLFVNPPRHCVHITQTLIVPLMSSHLNCSQCSFFSTAESPSKPEMMIKTKDKLQSVWWSPHPITIMTREIPSVISWHRSSGPLLAPLCPGWCCRKAGIWFLCSRKL